MKRSYLMALAASSLLVLGACGGADEEAEIEPVEDVTPAPPPPPAPLPIDSPADTLSGTGMTTTG
jgi:hypothetical protein